METFTGALIDTRSKEEKEKDYFQNEIVALANEVIWEEKSESQWRTFPVQNQERKNTCVANTARKMLRIIFTLLTGKDLDFSDAHIYKRRTNKGGGMIGVEAMKFITEGTTLYSMMPSEDKLNDDAIDAMVITDFDKKVGEVFKVDNYIQFKNGDFERVASTIQTTGKGIMVWFYFTSKEWSKLIPTIDDPNLDISKAARHSVTAVDITLKDGKKYIIVEDSAHFGGYTRHLISEEFFKARNFFSAYAMNFKYQKSDMFPKGKITKTLRFGMRDDQVVILQDALKETGDFPINSNSTGYFGGVTLSAVKKFQARYGLVIDGIVGPITISKLFLN